MIKDKLRHNPKVRSTKASSKCAAALVCAVARHAGWQGSKIQPWISSNGADTARNNAGIASEPVIEVSFLFHPPARLLFQTQQA